MEKKENKHKKIPKKPDNLLIIGDKPMERYFRLAHEILTNHNSVIFQVMNKGHRLGIVESIIHIMSTIGYAREISREKKDNIIDLTTGNKIYALEIIVEKIPKLQK